MKYLLIDVIVCHTYTTLLMTEDHYNNVKDWFFDTAGMKIEQVSVASEKGVKVG